MVTDEELIGSLDRMAESIDDLRTDMAEEGRKRDVRIRTNRRATRAAIFAAVLGLIVGATGVRQVHDSNADRASRTIASCQQYNAQQAVQTEAEISQSHDLVGRLSQGIHDPLERHRAVKSYNRSHDALIRSEHKPRDCSPAGIRKYLSKRPTQHT